MSEFLKIFVYGTLKIGGRFAKKFDKSRLSSKTGTIKGTMFSINNSFPGVVLQGGTTIIGEVHEYEESIEVERALDCLEGYHGRDDPHNLYDKYNVEVNTDDGVEKCKVYIFARETKNFDEVTNGTWEL